MIERVQPQTTQPPDNIEFAGDEAEPQARAPQHGEFDGNDTAPRIVSQLIEQTGRAAGHLALGEAHLVADRHGPQLRRAALDVAVALGIRIVFPTAFALAKYRYYLAAAHPRPGDSEASVPPASTWHWGLDLRPGRESVITFDDDRR